MLLSSQDKLWKNLDVWISVEAVVAETVVGVVLLI